MKACPNGALAIRDQGEDVMALIGNGRTVAILDPSFPGAFPQSDPLCLIGALRELGFSSIWEASFGAESLLPYYADYVKAHSEESGRSVAFASMCPAVVAFIEHCRPELAGNLVPLVSPTVAASRVARALGEKRVVFIGPCPAEKLEAGFGGVPGGPNIAITYAELSRLLDNVGVSVDQCPASLPDVRASGAGRMLGLPAGLLRALRIRDDVAPPGILLAEGKEECLKLVEASLSGALGGSFVVASICRSCVDGTGFPEGASLWDRRRAVVDYIKEASSVGSMEVDGALRAVSASADFKRRYLPRKIPLAPKETDVRTALLGMGMRSPEDELDCGLCGFQSCRERAIAVARGTTEASECFPRRNARLSEECARLSQLASDLDAIVNTSCEISYVCDPDGWIVRASRAANDIIGVENANLHKVNMKNLPRRLCPDVAIQALHEVKRVMAIRDLPGGHRLLAAASPILDGDGACRGVAATITDLSGAALEINTTPTASSFATDADSEDMVAYSPAMEELLTLVHKVANVSSTVLITGESGVGKEVVARYIHRTGNRASGPFVKINCAAIPHTLLESELFGYEEGAFTGARKSGKPGLIQLASGGTLFLDEISEMPLGIQAKLLQVLQEKCLVRVGGTEQVRVDARIMAATNRDLRAAVKEGRFRGDLYFRLNVIPIRVPPLRERSGDIAPLTYHFIEKWDSRYGRNHQISREACSLLECYRWPGNVRELENLIEFLVVTVDDPVILPEHLPQHVVAGEGERDVQVSVSGIMPLRQAVEEVERQLIALAAEACSTTYSMAKALGVNQSTVVRKMQKYMETPEEEAEETGNV